LPILRLADWDGHTPLHLPIRWIEPGAVGGEHDMSDGADNLKAAIHSKLDGLLELVDEAREKDWLNSWDATEIRLDVAHIRRVIDEA
jgi:hypothetical protein